jgi:hypothetical protein
LGTLVAFLIPAQAAAETPGWGEYRNKALRRRVESFDLGAAKVVPVLTQKVRDRFIEITVRNVERLVEEEVDERRAEAAAAVAAASASSTETIGTPSYTSTGSVWDAVVACEASGNWGLVTTGNGYYFAMQFDPNTWLAYGGTQAELDAGIAPSPSRLIQVAEAVLAGQGPGAWPNCFPS